MLRGSFTIICYYWVGHGPLSAVCMKHTAFCAAAVFSCSCGVTVRQNCLLSIQICRLCSSCTASYELRHDVRTWRERHSHSPKHRAQGDSKVHSCCHMVVSPIQLIYRHIIAQIKALALPLNIIFQLRPQHFAHSSATWRMQTQHLSWQSQEEQQRNISNSLFQFQYAWFWLAGFLLAPPCIKQLHAVRSRLGGWPCRWSSTPNPRTMMIVVEPRKTERAKCVGAGLMDPLRNSGPYQTVKDIQVVTITVHLRCGAVC